MLTRHQNEPQPRTNRPSGRLAKVLYGCATCALLFGAPPAFGAAVVTNRTISTVSYAQTNVPVTFGQVFKQGDIPAGATVVAALNSQAIPLQVDAKATYADGSLRHAVLTTTVPSLAGAATLPLTLSAGKSPATNNGAVTLTQLLGSSYDANVSLSIGGQKYTASARTLLQAANATKACKPWGTQCNQWLSGPQVSEWVVNGPVTAANGKVDANLRVYFAVRVYASGAQGSVSKVRTDVIVENTSAFAAQAQPQYVATVTSGNEVYVTPALTQYTATRWHKVLWWNHVQPEVYLQQDTQYIQASKAVSRYMPLQPTEKFLAGLRQTCAPLDHCDQTQKMHMTGAQAAIGPLPRWTSVYIVHPDVRAYNWMLANTDALGAYDIHYRDAATGWPVSIQNHPVVTKAAWAYANGVAKRDMTGSAANQEKIAAYRRDLLPNCVNNAVVSGCTAGSYKTGSPALWDNAHQPAQSYVPYMVTGDYYYMSELAFAASHNNLWANPVYRGLSEGLIDGGHAQTRGKAWTLRDMANAAWLLPDHYPLKAEFKASVENSLADWNKKYTNNPDANPLAMMNSGATYPIVDAQKRRTGEKGMAPWMHNFLTWSAGHAAELGFDGAAEFRNWLARFEIGLMTDWQANPTHGYCWLKAATYTLIVKDANGNWLPNYQAAYAATFPSLVGMVCNSPEMIAAISKSENQPWKAGQLSGYAYSATGFPSNLQIGLAAAADSPLPKANEAWDLFDSRSVKPTGATAYNNYPNFAVVPRAAPQTPTTPPPSTTPPPAVVAPANPPTKPPTDSTTAQSPEVWQTLNVSTKVIHVGDTFTVSGTLNYKSGMTKPVTAYRLHGFDKTIVSAPNSYTPKFLALKVGTTRIKNDNSGVTGVVTITVLPSAPL